MPPTMRLSVCGAFAMRRNSQLAKQLAKEEEEQDRTTKIMMSLPIEAQTDNEIKTERVQKHQQQQQQHEQNTQIELEGRRCSYRLPMINLSETLKSAQNKQQEGVKSTPKKQLPQKSTEMQNQELKTKTKFKFIMSHSWLLAAILLVVLVARSAHGSPRHLSGRHLIMPHKHHVHHRSAGNETPSPPPSPTASSSSSSSSKQASKGEVRIQKYCELRRPGNRLHELEKILDTCTEALASMEAMVELWLQREEGMTFQNMSIAYNLWHFDLKYWLSSKANNEECSCLGDGHMELDFTQDLISLYVIEHLLNTGTTSIGHAEKELYREHVLNNISRIKDSFSVCLPASSYAFDYNGAFPKRDFAIMREAIKVLRTLKAKYTALKDVEALGGPGQ